MYLTFPRFSGPGWRPGYSRINALEISDSDKAAIFGGNAVGLLGL